MVGVHGMFARLIESAIAQYNMATIWIIINNLRWLSLPVCIDMHVAWKTHVDEQFWSMQD